MRTTIKVNGDMFKRADITDLTSLELLTIEMALRTLATDELASMSNRERADKIYRRIMEEHEREEIE